MRQRDEGHSSADFEAADGALQWSPSPESFDRETADKKDHARPQQRELLVEPRRAERDLFWRRPPIAAAGRRLPGEAFRDRGAVREMVGVDPRLGEPASKLSAGASAERLARRELDGARRLADDRDAIGDGSCDDGPCSLEIARVDALSARADPRMKACERSRAIYWQFRNEKRDSCQLVRYGRGAGIRTRDLLNPIQARCQTAPHPEIAASVLVVEL
jgi:hypothetical protein